jgi:hypothetical protein
MSRFPDWDWFESLTSELISLNIEINSGAEADDVARNFTASVALAYRLLTSNVTLSDTNSDLPDLDRLLKHKKRLDMNSDLPDSDYLLKHKLRLRKFWQEGHQLLFMVLQALNFILSKKPTQLLTVWKLSSHHLICVMKR